MTHYSLLTAHYSLLTTHFLLLTTHYSLLTAHYSLLTAFEDKHERAAISNLSSFDSEVHSSALTQAHLTPTLMHTHTYTHTYTYTYTHTSQYLSLPTSGS